MDWRDDEPQDSEPIAVSFPPLNNSFTPSPIRRYSLNYTHRQKPFCPTNYAGSEGDANYALLSKVYRVFSKSW